MHTRVTIPRVSQVDGCDTIGFIESYNQRTGIGMFYDVLSKMRMLFSDANVCDHRTPREGDNIVARYDHTGPIIRIGRSAD